LETSFKEQEMHYKRNIEKSLTTVEV